MARKNESRSKLPRRELLALLKAAKEQPDDLTPRLVLADWLEEHGDEADRARGELVRIQCRLPSRPPTASNDSLEITPWVTGDEASLLRRQDELLARYAAVWFGDIRDLALDWRCKRGLLFLVVPAAKLVQKGPAALAGTEAWAWVEGVSASAATPRQLSRLAGCPLLESVGRLELDRKVDRAGMEALVGSPWFARLKRLDLADSLVPSETLAVLASAASAGLGHLALSAGRLTTEACQTLAGTSTLTGLTTLNLSYNWLREEAIAALAGSPALAHVTSLILENNWAENEGTRALAASAHLSRLQHLDLSSNGLVEEGALALASSRAFPDLAHLALVGNDLTGHAAAALLSSPGLRRLVSLDLRLNEIGDLGPVLSASWPTTLRELDLSSNWFMDQTAELLGHAQAGQLTRLGLRDCELTAERLRELVSGPAVANLITLEVGDEDLGPDAAVALASSKHLVRLEVLGLGSSNLGAQGIEALARASWLGSLVTLDLSNNNIDREGAVALARLPLAGLASLNLDSNPLGDEGARAILESANLPRLSMLSLRNCGLSAAGKVRLAKSPGLARLRRLMLSDRGVGLARALLASPHAASLCLLVLEGGEPLPVELAILLRWRFPHCFV
jgi:uncharacterized protein (TIGR02996 family)